MDKVPYDLGLKMLEVMPEMYKWHTLEEPLRCEYHFDLKFNLHFRKCAIHIEGHPNVADLIQNTFCRPYERHDTALIANRLHWEVKRIVQSTFLEVFTMPVYDYINQHKYLEYPLEHVYRGANNMIQIAKKELMRFSRVMGDLNPIEGCHEPIYLDGDELQEYFALKIAKQFRVHMFRKRLEASMTLAKQNMPRELVNLILSY